MYKKRLAKWGFQKNSKRATVTMQTPRTNGGCRKLRRLTEPGSILGSPRFSQHDSLRFMFLTSVRTWSCAFFEFVQSRNRATTSRQLQHAMDHALAVKTKEICFAFKVMNDLLDKGHGILAGRVARKAFLLIEDMLTLEGPALVWNLLEMMYSMIMLRHMRLFHMLLAHLIALADKRMPETHPLSTMLRGLRCLVADIKNTSSNSSKPLPSVLSPSRVSSTSNEGATDTVDTWLLSRALLTLIDQAWVFNAKFLFDNFDPRLIQLYCCISWDCCSISLPTAIVSAADRWLNKSKAQKPGIPKKAYPTDEAPLDIPTEKDGRPQRPLNPRIDATPLQEYEMLHTSSIAALREHRKLIFDNGTGFKGDTTTFLGTLAALVTSKLLESRPATTGSSDEARRAKAKLTTSRLYAGTAAGTLRALMSLNNGGGTGVSSETVEQIRTIVTLREYALGKTDPQVVRELWQLEDALITVGQFGKAQEVGREVYHRLERYVQDIPVGSA